MTPKKPKKLNLSIHVELRLSCHTIIIKNTLIPEAFGSALTPLVLRGTLLVSPFLG
jgi:hypothetical protein